MARSGSQFMIGLTLLNVGILAVHLFTASARADSSIVTASEVRIVDADGVVRARLGPDPENQQPCLVLLDRKGTALLKLEACDWGATGLSINDRNGAVHTDLAVDNHGDPSLSLYGGSGLATENLASDEGVAVSAWDSRESPAGPSGRARFRGSYCTARTSGEGGLGTTTGSSSGPLSTSRRAS